MCVSVRNTKASQCCLRMHFYSESCPTAGQLASLLLVCGGKETNQCGFGSVQRTLGMWTDPRKNYLWISVHQSRSHLHHMLKPKDQHLPRAYSSWLCLTRTPLLTYKSGQGASTFTRQFHGARHPLTPVSAFKKMPTSLTYSFNWFDLIYFAPNCQPGKSY